jgi:DNA mismatch endonuclease (patch repair protein)
MTDVHNAETRSYNMSRIRSKNTKPEVTLRKELFANGFRFRIHAKDLPGKPDIVLKKYRTVIFVHGCFWHGHKDCKYFVVPKTRTEWWMNKIAGNQQNDIKNKASLEQTGWNVINVFECDLKKDKLATTINQVINDIKKNLPADNEK